MDEEIKGLEGKEFIRSFEFNQVSVKETDNTIELSVSSEYPVLREFGYEILDHKQESIRWERLKTGAAVRDTHKGDQVGVVEKAWLDNESGKLRTLIRFSKNTERAQQLLADIKDGIRKNVSIRYNIYRAVVEKVVNGIQYVRAIDWEPIHVAIEADGADPSVGVTRELPIKTQGDKSLLDEIKKVNDEVSNIKIIINQKEQVKMDDEKKLQEQQRVDAINKLAEKFAGKVTGVDLMDAAELYKAGGKSEREFADMIFENQKQQAAVAGPTVHLSDKELKIYNPANAVRSLVNKTNSLEREVSDQYAKSSGITPAGIFIPHNAILPKMRTGRRDLTAGTATSAAELVGTDHLGAQFIDYLYDKMVLDNITFLPNRKGNVEIPVLSASAGHGWAATEVTAVAEGAPTTTEKTASPKRGGRFVEMTKQLMIQSDPSAEALFVNDLLKSLAIGMQNAILNGTGASGQPTGVKLTSGIGSVGSVASMDFEKAVMFETLIDDAFGDGNGMYFVTRRAHAGALKTRKIDAGSGRFVNENNVVNGYPIRTTNLVASGDVFFGDWTNVIVPLWDGVDLVFDPYTKAAEGMVKVTANQLLDVIVRYASAFSYGSDFS